MSTNTEKPRIKVVNKAQWTGWIFPAPVCRLAFSMEKSRDDWWRQLIRSDGV